MAFDELVVDTGEAGVAQETVSKTADNTIWRRTNQPRWSAKDFSAMRPIVSRPTIQQEPSPSTTADLSFPLFDRGMRGMIRSVTCWPTPM